MMDDKRVVWAIVGTIALVLAVIFLSEPVQRELRADPQRAFIAFEVEREGVARPGRLDLPAGTRFDIHAVLEARGRGGRTIYFTQAPGLEIDGVRVAPEDLRPWPGPEEIKILWFSVEGPRPFVEVGQGQAVDKLAFQAVFRPDWPRAWSIPGGIRPAREAGGEEPRRESFGTQRYQVRFELFSLSSALVPVATYDSLPASQVRSEVERYPTVTLHLPGLLELPSSVFGLTQLELAPEALPGQGAALRRLFVDRLAFSRLALLRAMLDSADADWETIAWEAAELAAGPAWGEGAVEAGHLLRAGERVVVLYEDRGEPGRLDYDDLCLDYLEGARVRRLSEVFTGEGLVEWTRLAAD